MKNNNQVIIPDSILKDAESMMDFLKSGNSVNEALIGFIESCLINNELPEFEKNNI